MTEPKTLLEKLKEVQEKVFLITNRCGTEMDYGSGSDAVQNGYILGRECFNTLDSIIEEVREKYTWKPINEMPETGELVFFAQEAGIFMAPAISSFPMSKKDKVKLANEGLWPNAKFITTHWMPLPNPPQQEKPE